MRELNDWLARDVNDRQDELRGVTARLDQLGVALVALQSMCNVSLKIAEVELHFRQTS